MGGFLENTIEGAGYKGRYKERKFVQGYNEEPYLEMSISKKTFACIILASLKWIYTDSLDFMIHCHG